MFIRDEVGKRDELTGVDYSKIALEQKIRSVIINDIYEIMIPVCISGNLGLMLLRNEYSKGI